MSDYLPPEESPSPAAPTIPHSREAEEAVVGAVLINPEAYYDVAQFLNADDFYIHRHRWIWEAFTRLHESRTPIDMLTVADDLERTGQLGEIGGPAFLTSLVNQVPTSLNAESYGKIVEAHSVRRKMITAANRIASIAYNTETNIEEVMGESEKAVFNVSERRLRHDLQPIRSVLSDYYDRIDDLAKRPEEIHGVPTGFIDLDKMLTGLQPSDLLIIAGRPGQGKCLAADSEIVLEDGSVSTIEDVYRQKSAQLLTLEDNFKLSFTSPSAFIDDGFKPTYKVTTALGRSVESTITHPFLTLQGWQPLSNLAVGDRIAVPRAIPVFGNIEMRECEIKLLAYLIGDGCLVHTSPEFTVGKRELKDDFEQAVLEFGGVRSTYNEPSNRTPNIAIANADRKRGRGVKNPLTEWLRSIGIFGLDSHHKFIPACVFTLPKHQLALFLNRLFATDGWVSATSAEIGYASVSEKMIRQIQHLLLRFRIIAGIRHRTINSPTPGKTAWSLDITDGPSLLEFVEQIGVYGQETKLEQFRQRFLESKFNTNNDTIPMEVWDTVQELKGEETWIGLAHRAGIQTASRKINLHVGKRAPSRTRLLQLAEALGSSSLTDLATSDIYWDKIIAIEPMGDNQVYDLTIPDTHNFVANDVCVHNTGFLLSVAKNAALTHKKHVAIFSLEMSNEQVVQRLIAQETGIDSQRLRSGKLTQEEWPLFTHSIEVFSDTKIFLDDTPAITPLQLRTKCRRLHMEFGIDLIIIDYLQLMSSDTRNDNRVQEVSFISRNLKVLARELNVPVLAAAQLSRAVEQRTDKRPVLSDLRESGCLTGESLVTLADSGKNVAIRELEGKSNFNIWALNPNTLKLESMPVSHAFCTGIKPVFKMKTRLGREIRATGNHQFLTVNGWKRLDELTTDDYLALPRVLPIGRAEQTMSNAELALLGHLIGDGCTLPRHVIQYTTREKDLADMVANLAVEVFGEEVNPRISPEREWYQVYLSSTRHHTHNVHSAVTDWLEELESFGLRSYEKRIPSRVFEQPNETIAVFLRHLWATDGSIQLVKGKKVRPIAYYASSSPRLAQDVQSLLLRLGINAILRRVPQNGKGRDQYNVIITGKADLEIFAERIGAVGEYKSGRLAEVQSHLNERDANTNRDVIPNNIWRMHVVPAMQEIGMTTRQMQAAIETQYCGTGLYKQNVSRERAARVANVVKSNELAMLAESDVYWDSISSIEPDGEEQVYDLTVPGHHNFVANNIIVHNSLEQDADIVMFIYRPDQYEKDTAKQNIAEIIISKHRNGPVGSVELIFRSALAKFENAATKHVQFNE